MKPRMNANGRELKNGSDAALRLKSELETAAWVARKLTELFSQMEDMMTRHGAAAGCTVCVEGMPSDIAMLLKSAKVLLPHYRVTIFSDKIVYRNFHCVCGLGYFSKMKPERTVTKRESKRGLVRICGQDFVVVEEDPPDWAGSTMGRSSMMKGRILIRDSMPKTAKDGTLIHEILHVILDMNGRRTESADEAFVSMLATALHAFMRDNPGVVARLVER